MLVAVVPVFYFKKPLHSPAGQVFQYCGSDDSCGVNHQEIFAKGEGNPQKQNSPCSVEGKHRKAEEPTVYKALFFQGNIGGFENPAEKTKYIKHEKPLIPSIIHKESFLKGQVNS